MKIKITASLAVCLVTILGLTNSAWASTISNTISIDNNGGGTITSSNGDVNCSNSHCDYNWTRALGTGITFYAAPKSGNKLIKFKSTGGSTWTNFCAEPDTSATCTISNADELHQIYAQYAYSDGSYKFTITTQGTGHGSFSVSSGSSCGTNCWTGYSYGDTFTVTAKPDSGSVFVGWEPTASYCYASSPGLGSTPTRNPNPTCSLHIGEGPQTISAVATFDKAPASSTNSSSSGGSSTAQNSQSASSSSTPSSPATTPASVSVSTVSAGESKFDTSKPISVSLGQSLLLSGKTVPNGLVTLTIHSTPQTVTALADKDGNWSYTITGLPAGSHYVEGSVKDPATGKSSQAVKLLSFTIMAAKAPAAAATGTTAAPIKKSPAGMYLLILVIPALLAGGWYTWRWWGKKRSSSSPTDMSLG